jgi:hypothetical protein
MNARLTERRRALVAKAQLQREVLQEAAADLRRGLAFTDHALALMARLRRKPVLTALTAAAVATLALRPRRALKWISFAATIYPLIRRVRALLRPGAT